MEYESRWGAPCLADVARHGIPDAIPTSELRKYEMSSRHRQLPSRFHILSAWRETLKRFHGGRDLHFLTFSCHRRQPLLTPNRCDLFLNILERVRRRYRLVVLGYVVMPEHVHLLASEPQRGTLSTAIQALKLGFVRKLEGPVVPRSRNTSETWGTPLSCTSGVPKHFWQARFYDFNVWTEKKRIEKLRYIHRNPVKRGLGASPEQWRWSSYRYYLCGETRSSQDQRHRDSGDDGSTEECLVFRKNRTLILEISTTEISTTVGWEVEISTEVGCPMSR